MRCGSAFPPVRNESLRHKTLPLHYHTPPPHPTPPNFIKLYIFLTNSSTKNPFPSEKMWLSGTIFRSAAPDQYDSPLALQNFCVANLLKLDNCGENSFQKCHMWHEKWKHLWVSSPKKPERTGKAVWRAILLLLQYIKKYSRTAPYCVYYQKMRQMWEKEDFRKNLSQLLALRLILDATYDNEVLARVSRQTHSNYSLGILDKQLTNIFIMTLQWHLNHSCVTYAEWIIF